MKKRSVKGQNYAAAEEVLQKKQAKKTARGMKTAGLALELKESQKKSPKPLSVKPQKKVSKLVKGKTKAY